MAHDTEKLRELLERVEAASGPDDDLDVALCVTLQWVGYPGDGIRNIRRSDDQGWIDYEDAEGECTDMVPAYSASIDASIALVERMLPGWGRSVYWNNCQGHLCAVEDNENSYNGSTNQTFEAPGATSAIALLAAMLKALISQAEGEAKHG